MRTSLILVLATLFTSASAQDRSPASLLGGIMIAMAVVEQCDLDLGRERERRLIAAAEKMQATAGVTDEEVRRLAAEMARDAAAANCETARAAVPGVVDDLLQQTETR